MCSLVRPSDVFDLFEMQHVNFVNLPENYVMKYYFFHSLSWPQLPTVAQDGQGKIVGYVLAKLEDENTQGQKPHGHVTSVAVLRQNRKLGLASKLMTLSQRAMEDIFAADYAALHVRVTNRAAYALYSKTLGFRVHDIDKEYYADKEDAFNMRNYFDKERRRKGRRPAEEEAACIPETSGKTQDSSVS
ncbi:N-alpha-acetyltransferase daf-31 [Cyclospora cayetanensis]|uniref:N-alpha-acetyltransferase daf-31 n=1 Tax=Cyclospora cayetanensis TaxID=88456 RepID=A0A6P6S2X6_9EIME|nr:N-alpha-acetyltransferase daf-31 [Cyclospora cayetanensis]